MRNFKNTRIVCLANSRKMGGRCVAGKEVLPGGRPGRWVRPVSAREDGGVSEDERQYEGGSEPRVLDVIDVPILHARPRDYQQENWLLDPDHYWERVGRFTAGELQHYLDPVGPLWVDGHSSSSGHNDRVPFSSAVSLSSSLKLIRVGGLALSVFYNRQRIRRQAKSAGTFQLCWYRVRAPRHRSRLRREVPEAVRWQLHRRQETSDRKSWRDVPRFWLQTHRRHYRTLMEEPV